MGEIKIMYSVNHRNVRGEKGYGTKDFGRDQKAFKDEVIEFDWEPIRKQPKRYGILYPIIGYIVLLLAIIFMGLGVFMWLFLIAGSILFLGGIYCANRIIGEYKKIKIQPEVEHGGHH